MDAEREEKCMRCQKVFPFSNQYFIQSGCRGGGQSLRKWCKPCRKEYYREWKKNNADKVQVNNKKYADENRKEINERHKQWKINNKDKVREYNRMLHARTMEEYPEKLRKKWKDWKRKNQPGAYKKKIRWMGRKLGIENPETVYDRVQDMLINQSGRCMICSEPLIPYAIDHCHKTKKLRGLLCNKHNLGIGYFNDNPLLLRLAADYIENSRCCSE